MKRLVTFRAGKKVDTGTHLYREGDTLREECDEQEIEFRLNQGFVLADPLNKPAPQDVEEETKPKRGRPKKS